MQLLAFVHLFIALDYCRRAYAEDFNIFSITCTDKFNKIRQKTSENTFTVQCPSCRLSICYLFGTGFYSPTSGICCAGVHDGKISNHGGTMVVNIYNKRRGNFRGSTQHGVMSQDQFHERGAYFTLTFTPGATAEMATAPVLTEKTTVTVDSHGKGTSEGAPPTETITNLSSLASFIGNTNNTSLPSKAAHLSNEFEEPDNGFLTTKSDSQSILTPANFHEDTVFPNESISSSKAITITAGTVAGVVVLVLVGVALKYFNIFSQICGEGVVCGRRARTNDCVCYLKMDSSTQSLLVDPDTCQRPCEIREIIEQAEELDVTCPNRFDSDCTESCTEKCNSTKFAF